MNQYTKGIYRGLSFWGISIVITLVSHLIFGHDYIRAPPASWAVAALLLMIGTARALWDIWIIYRNKETALHKGELTVLALPCVTYIILVLLFLR